MSELETIRSERGYGDFVIRLQYWNTDPNSPGSQYEPALVIARPRRVQSKAAWVLMLSSAWKYVDPETDSQHSQYMMDASKKIAEMLRLQPMHASTGRISNTIHPFASPMPMAACSRAMPTYIGLRVKR